MSHVITIYRVDTGPGVNKEYDEVERFFKNPMYEGTSSRNTSTAAVMYDTVGLPSKQIMTHAAAAENGHMYEALDKQDANGTTLCIGLNSCTMFMSLNPFPRLHYSTLATT